MTTSIHLRVYLTFCFHLVHQRKQTASAFSGNVSGSQHCCLFYPDSFTTGRAIIMHRFPAVNNLEIFHFSGSAARQKKRSSPQKIIADDFLWRSCLSTLRGYRPDFPERREIPTRLYQPLEAISTISIERRIKAVICSASSGLLESAARSYSCFISSTLRSSFSRSDRWAMVSFRLFRMTL